MLSLQPSAKASRERSRSQIPSQKPPFLPSFRPSRVEETALPSAMPFSSPLNEPSKLPSHYPSKEPSSAPSPILSGEQFSLTNVTSSDGPSSWLSFSQRPSVEEVSIGDSFRGSKRQGLTHNVSEKESFYQRDQLPLGGDFCARQVRRDSYETGQDVSQLYMELYNGETGESYGDTLVASTDGTQGTDDVGGLSFVVFSTPDIRSIASGNGVAVVDGLTDRVFDFISYDGQFVATNGAANTIESVDIGVSQADIISSDGILSLQLSGLGCLGSDFTWEIPQLQTPGGLNRQQTATCLALEPSADPSVFYSLAPSILPSVLPSKAPSDLPSVSPSMRPSNEPSETPSVSPSLTPSAVCMMRPCPKWLLPQSLWMILTLHMSSTSSPCQKTKREKAKRNILLWMRKASMG